MTQTFRDNCFSRQSVGRNERFASTPNANCFDIDLRHVTLKTQQTEIKSTFAKCACDLLNYLFPKFIWPARLRWCDAFVDVACAVSKVMFERNDPLSKRAMPRHFCFVSIRKINTVVEARAHTKSNQTKSDHFVEHFTKSTNRIGPKTIHRFAFCLACEFRYDENFHRKLIARNEPLCWSVCWPRWEKCLSKKTAGRRRRHENVLDLTYETVWAWLQQWR